VERKLLKEKMERRLFCMAKWEKGKASENDIELQASEEEKGNGV